MPQDKRDNWEDRFDEEVGTFEIKVRQILPNGKMIPAGKITEQTIKDFIDSLLAEKVERLTKKKGECYEEGDEPEFEEYDGESEENTRIQGYNQAIDDAIQIIKE